MQVRFFGQPYVGGKDLRDFFDETVADTSLTNLTVVVAWAKASGLDRVRNHLSAIRDRGNTRIVLGIDEGGGTAEGLTLARDLFDEAHVFHDRRGGTFHPKIYLASGDTDAALLVGSQNLTAGGLYANNEAALVVNADATAEPILEAQAYIDGLYSDPGVCVPLTEERLQELLDDPQYRIGPEKRSSTAVGDDGEQSPQHGVKDDSMFGDSQFSRRKPMPRASAPSGAGKTKSKQAATGGSSPVKGTAKRASSTVPAGVKSSVVKRWSKKLSYSDAQQRRTSNTQITGNLKLTQARHPINHESWFRHDFFGAEAWNQTQEQRGVKEVASVEFDVTVGGVDLGRHTLRVDHADYRVAGQANVPTWLHWDDLGAHMQSNDHVGEYVTIERRSDGSYGLNIEAQPTGPVLP